MEIQNYKYTFTHVPPGFKRGRLALIAVFQDHHLLLSRKHAYPGTVYRLLGGGIDLGEDATSAAKREFLEEAAVNLDEANFHHEATFHLDLNETSTDTTYTYDIELFTVHLTNEHLTPSDDINLIQPFTKEELLENISQLKSLSPELVQPKKDLNPFRWSDWGSVFGLIHEYVLNHWPN